MISTNVNKKNKYFGQSALSITSPVLYVNKNLLEPANKFVGLVQSQPTSLCSNL
jgi:hypothetical protein